MKLFNTIILILFITAIQIKAQKQINPDGSSPLVNLIPYYSKINNFNTDDNYSYKIEIKVPISSYLSFGGFYDKQANHFTGIHSTNYKINTFQYNVTYYLNYYSSLLSKSSEITNPDGNYPSINFSNYYYKSQNYDLQNYFNFTFRLKVPITYYFTLSGFYENQKVKINMMNSAVYKTERYGLSLNYYSSFFNYSKIQINPDGFGPSIHFTGFLSKINSETKNSFNYNINLKIPLTYYLTFSGFYQSEGFDSIKSIPSNWTALHYGIIVTYYFNHLYNLVNNL